jgi:hypothetical protein
MDVQAGLDPCWSQTHYVGFVMAKLILFISKQSAKLNLYNGLSIFEVIL